MVSKKSHHLDYPLAVAVAILLILGILILASVSADFSQERFGKTTYYLFHQIIWGLGIGIVLGFIAFIVPLSFLKKWAWVLVLINLIFMVLVFIPGLSIVAGGAPRWINFGLFTFQPSEFLKLTFILYLSVLLATRTSRKNDTKSPSPSELAPAGSWRTTLAPFIILLGIISLILYFQSDASTLFLIFTISALIYFLANISLWHVLMLVLIGLGGLAFFIFEPYRMNRILVYLGLVKDPMKVGYQIKQALITLGSGGILGLGLGMSSQKVSGFLPQPMSDSIFAIFAEELGFIGSLILISLFLVFLWRGFRVAKKSQDKFSQLFAAGFSAWICLQAFVNIGAIIGIIPLTGIPLPFISYGGSHVIAELIGVGILLNISKNVKK